MLSNRNLQTSRGPLFSGDMSVSFREKLSFLHQLRIPHQSNQVATSLRLSPSPTFAKPARPKSITFAMRPQRRSLHSVIKQLSWKVGDENGMKMGLPSRELTYPHPKVYLKMIFLFSKVGYVSSLEGKWDEMADEGKQTNFKTIWWGFGDVRAPKQLDGLV